eukprot:scaffold884_cov288-Chaetoceros_neogracile.AAC.3
MILRRMRANPECGGGGASRGSLILPSKADTAKYRSSGDSSEATIRSAVGRYLLAVEFVESYSGGMIGIGLMEKAGGAGAGGVVGAVPEISVSFSG